MNEKLVPNSAQIPNILLDRVLPRLTEAEARCLLYIARRTYGFHKDADRISLSQFVDGIKSVKTGEVLDDGTGLSRPGVVAGLEGLKEKKLIKVQANAQDRWYEINMEASLEWLQGQLVKEVNQLKELTSIVKEVNYPPEYVLVKEVNPQKTGGGKKGGEESPPAVPKGDVDAIIGLFEPVNPTFRRLFPIKTERAAVARMLKQFGREKVVSMVSALPGIISQPFAPRITTPYQLERDMGKLVLFVKQSQRSSNKAVRIS